jgi:hypothetical protein
MDFPLTRGYVAQIDAEDLDKLQQWKWHARFCKPSVYAARTFRLHSPKQESKNCKLVTIYMHRFLMDAPLGMQVDHLNGDCLDNRKANLELVTPDENLARRRYR